LSDRSSVVDRVEALAEALEAGAAVLPEPVRQQGAELVARARERLALAAGTTVVALAGATGSGKSSLLNALAGAPLVRPGTLRPTTAAAEAASWSGEPAEVDALLDWLQVQVRHTAPAVDGVPTDLVLLDLPDHDSVVAAHREVAERLYQRVDLLVWVLDPQKYADGVLHERYLRPLAALAPVMLLVLNQSDRLTTQEQAACLADLRRLAGEDGLAKVPVLAVSARTDLGVPELRDLLVAAARRRRAANERLGAEVAALARQVVAACGPAQRGRARQRADEELVDALEGAAGVPVVVDAVRRSAARSARAATGWPPLRWLARLRADPLRRLHLRTGTPQHPELTRTSLPPVGAALRAGAAGAVRTYLDGATAGAPDEWVLAVRATVRADGLGDALDQAIARTTLLPSRPARWWRLVGAVHWVALGAALGGVLWLVGLSVAERALLVPVAAPVWRGLPVPTWLVAAGLLLGLVLALLGAGFGALGARRRAARARRRLRSAVNDVAQVEVVAPVDAALARLARCRAAAVRAADRPAASSDRRPDR
jgi:GTP-binding protein EngB required for normal cell division